MLISTQRAARELAQFTSSLRCTLNKLTEPRLFTIMNHKEAWLCWLAQAYAATSIALMALSTRLSSQQKIAHLCFANNSLHAYTCLVVYLYLSERSDRVFTCTIIKGERWCIDHSAGLSPRGWGVQVPPGLRWATCTSLPPIKSKLMVGRWDGWGDGRSSHTEAKKIKSLMFLIHNRALLRPTQLIAIRLLLLLVSVTNILVFPSD